MLKKIISAILTAAPFAVVAEGVTTTHEEQHTMLSSEELKSWYDQKQPMIVLDARSEKYYDGTLLPNAQWLSAESSEKEIASLLPNKDSLIVVYCWSTSCPASGWLYTKLKSMGYNNLYEYHEGLQKWMEKGYPTTKQSKL